MADLLLSAMPEPLALSQKERNGARRAAAMTDKCTGCEVRDKLIASIAYLVETAWTDDLKMRILLALDRYKRENPCL